jgi:hypothetical protein
MLHAEGERPYSFDTMRMNQNTTIWDCVHKCHQYEASYLLDGNFVDVFH